MKEYTYPEDPSEYLTIVQATSLKYNLNPITSLHKGESVHTIMKRLSQGFNIEICKLPGATRSKRVSSICYRTGLYYLISRRGEDSPYYASLTIPPFTKPDLDKYLPDPSTTPLIQEASYEYPPNLYFEALLQAEKFYDSPEGDPEQNPNKFLPTREELNNG